MNFVPSETESVGMAHCEVAKKIDELDRRVKGFRDEQKTERAKVSHGKLCYLVNKEQLLLMIHCGHTTILGSMKIKFC